MKRYAPAAARNSVPTAEMLAQELPGEGLVLEVASGSGEHAVFFARRFPALAWQPSDADPEALTSVEAWRIEVGLANLLSPLALDAASPNWPISHANAIVCVNMVHIAPWAATLGLFAGAGKLLPVSAPLILYGPFFEDDVLTTSSNSAFDQSLRERDTAWGLRRAEAMNGVAREAGFARTARYALPANNIVLVYRRTASSAES